MLPDLAELSGTPLERATSISAAVRRGATLVGAPIGGALILLIGTQNVLLIDAASFLVSALLITLRTPAMTYSEAEAAATRVSTRRWRAYRDDLLEGVRFVWRDRLARSIVLTRDGDQFP